MIRKLRGNTRTITWTLLTNGQATSLVGMDLTLELVSPSGAHKPMPYTVSGNTLTTTWQGKEQKECGEYSLVLWDNRNHDGQAIAKRDRFIELIDEGKETINGTIIDNSPSGGSVNVVDNLTSTSATDALSANMGRALNEAKADKATTLTGYGITDAYTKAQTDTALGGKANTSHSHAISDVTNLQNSLDGKANTSHTHTIANVSGLQTALDGKQATLATYTDNANSTTTIANRYVKIDCDNIYKVDDGVEKEILPKVDLDAYYATQADVSRKRTNISWDVVDVNTPTTITINADNYKSATLIRCTASLTISSISNLSVDVAIIVGTGVQVTLPTGTLVCGSIDTTKPYAIDILSGYCVIGNFEELS